MVLNILCYDIGHRIINSCAPLQVLLTTDGKSGDVISETHRLRPTAFAIMAQQFTPLPGVDTNDVLDEEPVDRMLVAKLEKLARSA